MPQDSRGSTCQCWKDFYSEIVFSVCYLSLWEFFVFFLNSNMTTQFESSIMTYSGIKQFNVCYGVGESPVFLPVQRELWQEFL